MQYDSAYGCMDMLISQQEDLSMQLIVIAAAFIYFFVFDGPVAEISVITLLIFYILLNRPK